MTLLDLVKMRRKLAKDFSKSFHDRVKQDLKDYKVEPQTITDVLNIDLREVSQKRYHFQIPLIFTNHEGMMASMFDRPPDIIFNQRGKDDSKKAYVVKAAYEYLKDAMSLEMFMTDAAWWYLLSGFVSAHVGYNQKAIEQPQLDEHGQPVIGEDGKPLTYVDYTDDDPTLEVGDPFKESFAPESKYSVDSKKIPFYVLDGLMSPEDILQTYGKKVEADASIKTSGKEEDEEAKDDLERTNVYFYYGTLPKKVRGEVRGWAADKEFAVIFTDKEVLYKDTLPLGEKQCRVLKWHGPPNEFYGFGIAKLLAPFQREKSMRRGQLARYADIAAFPKILHGLDTKLDTKTARDPRENLILQYQDIKPEYLSPPQINAAVIDSANYADQDAQATSGMMDLSNGAQNSSTVDTATGQTIFADAAEKRMRLAKKKFLYFYLEVVILLLKMCQLNWSTTKVVEIIDDNGNPMTIKLNRDSFKDIDFDRDIDVDFESTSINKDVIREQAIALYDKAKDDPLANRKELLKDAIQEGFNRKNPEKYINESALTPGMTLMSETGEQFVVDETGQVVPAQDMATTAQPSTNPIASSQSGMMGAAQNV